MIVFCLTADGLWRTYNGFMPHCRCMGDGGTDDLQWFFTIIHFLVGGLVSSPAMSPSQTAVWDLLHFPLVAPLVLLRYTFPDSSFDSSLA